MNEILLNPIIQKLVAFSLTLSLLPAIWYFLKLHIAKRKATRERGFLMQIIPPKYSLEDENNKRSVRFSLQRFMDNLTVSARNHRIAFEIFATHEAIKFLVWTPTKEVQRLIKLNLYATYKERIKIANLDFDPAFNFNSLNSSLNEYKTLKHEIYSLMDLKDFEGVDPVQSILTSLSGLGENEQVLFQIALQPTRLNKTAMRMARENFRLMRGEISWISVFLSQVESYVFYAVHLLPVITMKLLSAVFAAFGSEQNSSDPMAILPDSDPRKVMVEKVDMQEFNNSISEKYKTPFISYIRVAARGNKQVENLASVEQALETMKSENQNRLVRLSSKKFSDLHSRFLFPESNIFPFYRRLVTSQNILSSREISMLYHLPLKISSAVIEYFSVPHIPAKKDFKNKKTKQALELGINYAREQSAKAYLSEENRKRHLVVTGQTGTGKSTILKRLMLQDIDARVKHGQKRGLLLLDPHEDFFRDILIRLPDNFEESNSLLIWDNANPDYAFGFNPIFAVGMSDREIDLTVDSNYKLIEKLIKRANPETGMGTTGKPMLINAMKTLMVFQNEWLLQHGDKELISKFAPTLIEIKTLFSNEDFRNTIIDGINLEKYEDLRSFWQETFPTYLESKNWQEIKQGFDNKISQITTGSLFATFAQSKSAFNIPAIISRSKILLVNLSSKHIGEEGMSLLGSLLMSKIWFEARRIEAEARRPFVVYADEFQNFATPDFAQALSEARKFKLELILAHQFFGQLPENIFQAVMGNVKSKIYYRAGLDDALIIAQELQGKILKEEAMEIPEYNANVKVGDEVFSIYVPEERKPSFTDTHIEDFIESEVFAKAKSKQQVARDIQTRRRWFTDGCPIDYELSTN